VNRGPSLALAILFDRGMDPLAAFDLLRARRPQAFAIYAPQFLRHEGRLEDAEVLEAFMELETPREDLIAAIGRIRDAEADGTYRFPLRSDESLAPEEESTESEGGLRHRGSPSDETFEALVDLMIEFHGGLTTEWPLDWVRGLMEQLNRMREQNYFPMPEGFCATELYAAVDLWKEKRGW